MVTTGTAALAAVCGLTACSISPSPSQKAAVRGILASTTTTTATGTAAKTTTSTPAAISDVVVPNLVGLKIAPARAALRAVGLHALDLNTPCNKGTVASQSVVTSLSIPGKEPTPALGAVPLTPGAMVPRGTRVGITWSGCYGGGAVVPDLVGLTFGAAVHALHAAGLAWACYSGVGPATSTTSSTTATSTTGGSSTSSSTSTSAVTTTTAAPSRTVLAQDPAAGTVLRPGSPVSVTMRACPQ